MSLLTLPRYPPDAVARTREAAVAALDAPPPLLRGRAAHALASAVRDGRLSPAKVQHAARLGDRAIARLLRQHTPRLRRPQLTREPFPLKAHAQTPSPHVLAGLVRLMRVLAADGDLTPAQCQTLAAPQLTMTDRYLILNRAWNMRCKRLTAPLMALLPRGAKPCSGFTVLPGAFAAAVFDHSEGGHDGFLIRDDGAPHDVFMGASGLMLVTATASHHDPQALAALHGAWNACTRATVLPVCARAAEALEMTMTYLAEVLRDAALGATWRGNDPHLGAEHLGVLSQEIGFDMSDEDQSAQVHDALRFFRAMEHLPRWEPTTAAFKRWRRRHGTTPVGRQITTLLALSAMASKLAPPLPEWRRCKRDMTDDAGPLAIGLFPIKTGLDEYFSDVVMQEITSVATAEIAVSLPTTRRPSLTALARLFDRTIIDAGLAAAMTAVLAHRFDRATKANKKKRRHSAAKRAISASTAHAVN